MNEDKLKKAYESAKKHYSLPDFEVFKADMTDEKKLLKFRESLAVHYDVPDAEVFKADMGLKKKEHSEVLPSGTSQKPWDFQEDSSMGAQPSTTPVEATTQDSLEVAKPLPSIGETTKPAQPFNPQIRAGIVKIAKEKPEIFATEDGLKGLEKSLRNKGITSQEEIDYYKDIATGGEQERERRVIQDRQKKLTEDVFVKTMSTAGRRGIPYEAGDIPKSMDDLNVLSGAKKNYTDMMTNKLYSHVPEDMKMKAAIVQKQKELVGQLKSPDVDIKERNSIRAKLTALETELGLADFNKKLYNLATGQYVDQEKASPEDISFEQEVQSRVKNKYSELDKTYQAAEKASHLFDHYDEEINKPAVDEDGNPIMYQGKEVPLRALALSDFIPSTDVQRNRAKLLYDKWLDSKINVEAISRAIMLNEDPSQVKRGFFGDAGLTSALGKGFNEAIDNRSETADNADFATRFVDVINEFGDKKLLTKKQVENAKQTFGEVVVTGVGASIPTMANIAITSYATEGLGTLPAVVRATSMFKKLFGASKAGKLAYNMLGEGVKGYISYAPTSESGATGIGEGMTQGAMDTFMPEKFLGGKYKALGYLLRVGAGTTTESIQESVGGYVNALSENGFDVKKAFYDAFGRTPEERWEYLMVLNATSAMFSSAFNIKHLPGINSLLKREVESGNVPVEDMDAVKEVIANNEERIKAGAPKTEVPNVPDPIEDETKVGEEPKAKKIVIVEGEKSTELTPEEFDKKLKDPEFVNKLSKGDIDITEGVDAKQEEKVVSAVEEQSQATTEEVETPVAEEAKVETKTEQNDSEDKTGLPSADAKGETIESVEPNGRTSTEEVQAGGVQGETIKPRESRKKVRGTDKPSEKPRKPKVKKELDRKRMNEILSSLPQEVVDKHFRYGIAPNITPRLFEARLRQAIGQEEAFKLTRPVVEEVKSEPKKAVVSIGGKDTELSEGMAVSVVDGRNTQRKEVYEIVYRKKKDEITGRSIKDADGNFIEEVVGFKPSKSGQVIPISKISEVLKTVEAEKAKVKEVEKKVEPVVQEVAPVVEKVEPVAEKAKPVVEEAKPVVSKESPAVQALRSKLAEVDGKLEAIALEKKKTDVRGFKPLSERQKALEEEKTEIVKDIQKTKKSEKEATEVKEEEKSKPKKEKGKVDTKESLIEELNNLEPGEDPRDIYRRAREIKVNDVEFTAAYKKPYNDFAILQSKESKPKKTVDLEEEARKIEEEIKSGKLGRDKIAQAESRITVIKYLQEAINKINKAFPNVKVEFDTSQSTLGEIRDGKVYINPELAKTDTPFHEFSHIFVKVLKSKNPILYSAAIELVSRDTDTMDFVRNTRPDLTEEADIAEEALNIAIGEKTAEDFIKMKDANPIKKVWNKIIEIARRIFGIKPSISNVDIASMTLKDFIKLVSADLLSERPLSTISTSDVKKIMNSNVARTLNFDSDVLVPKPIGGIAKGIPGEIKKGVIKLINITKPVFRSRDTLPEWIFNLDNNTRAAVAAHISEAGKHVNIFNEQLKVHIKSKKLNNAEIETLLNDVNKLLIGDITGSAFITKHGVSGKFTGAVANMRNNIDEMSKALLEGGYIKGKLKQTINDNLGIYLKRSYEIHKNRPASVEEWFGQISEDVRERAEQWLEKALNTNDVNEVTFKKDKNGNYVIKMKNIHGIGSKYVTVSRGEIESLLYNNGDTTKDIDELLESDKENTVDLTSGVNPKLFGIEFKGTDEDIADAMDSIIRHHLEDDSKEAFAVRGINKKDTSVLKKRKDIPEEIRELLGEIHEPTYNYIETISKMANLVEYSKMLDRIKTQGKNTLVWSKKDAPRGTVPFPDTPRWKPLNGMYTTPEFLKAINEYEKDALITTDSRLIQTINTAAMLLNTATKSAMTKWNPGSNARNHWGALMMAFRHGYYNVFEMWDALTDYYSATRIVSKKDPVLLAELKAMKAYGMFDDNIGINAIQDSMNRAIKSSTAIKNASNKVKNSWIGRGTKGTREGVSKFYQAPDAAVKIFLFRKMKADYRLAYPNMTEQALNDKVAAIVKDTMPSYSRMSKAAKALSRNPVIGSFASFATEMVRNNYNQLVLTTRELKEAKLTGNTKLRDMAKKRRRWQVGMTAVVPILGTILKLRAGIDDEEEREIRSDFADYEKNSWMLWLGKSNGVLSLVDLSYTDPQSAFTKPIMALYLAMRDDDVSAYEAVEESLKEIGNQYFGEEPLFKAINEGWEGFDQYGRPIANEYLDEDYKRVLHVAKIMVPRVITVGIDAGFLYFGDEGDNQLGKKYTPTTFAISNLLGVRLQERDMKTAAMYKIGRDQEKITEIKKTYSAGGKTPEALEIVNKELRKLFNEHLLNIRGAVAAGASRDQVIEMLSTKKKDGKTPYVRKEWARQLSEHDFQPYEPEDESEGSSVPSGKPKSLADSML